MNINNFEKKISPVIYQRGQEYFMDGAVTELELSDDNRWLAIVEGSENYSVAVEISIQGEIVDYECDCPYDGEICKHVVTTLLNGRKIAHDKYIDELCQIPERKILTGNA